MFRSKNGDIIEVQYVGKEVPSDNAIVEAYNGSKKDIRIKGVKKLTGPENIGTLEGIGKNAARGLTFGLSRKLERLFGGNPAALDKYNEKHPFISTAADIVGGIPLTAVGVGGVKTAAKLVSKLPFLAKAAKSSKFLQKAAKILTNKYVKTGATGGTYSGVRSNIESRDEGDPNVAKNTALSTGAGAALGVALRGVGTGLGRALSKNQIKAKNFISNVGGKEKFKALTTSTAKLIESEDPLIKDLLTSTKLSAHDKAVVFDKYMQSRMGLKNKAAETLNILAPKKSQSLFDEGYKSLYDKRYAKVDPNTNIKVNATESVGVVTPAGKVKMTIKPLEDSRNFVAARKKAASRQPTRMGGEENQHLSNDVSLQQLVGIKQELFDMMGQHKARGRNLDAAAIAENIKDINNLIKAKSPDMAKADASFHRAKTAQEAYKQGIDFKGFTPGEEAPKTTTSFVRGLMEQARARKANLSPDAVPTKLTDVLPQHVQNVLEQGTPETMRGIRTDWRRAGAEHSNLAAAMANMPAYKQGLDLHGNAIVSALTRPKKTLIKGIKSGLGGLENKYQYSPNELMQTLYAPAQDVYKEVSKRAAKPTKSGKVLDAVMTAIGNTGARGAWGGKY
jgi:hypothetical protein